MASNYGPTKPNMKVSGRTIEQTERAKSHMQMVTLTKAIGKTIKHMESVCTSARMVLATRENGGMIFNMEKGLKHGQTRQFSMEVSKMAKRKVRVR
jgi:hypothetical protein